MTFTRHQRTPLGAFYRTPLGAFGPGAEEEEAPSDIVATVTVSSLTDFQNFLNNNGRAWLQGGDPNFPDCVAQQSALVEADSPTRYGYQFDFDISTSPPRPFVDGEWLKWRVTGDVSGSVYDLATNLDAGQVCVTATTECHWSVGTWTRPSDSQITPDTSAGWTLDAGRLAGGFRTMSHEVSPIPLFNVGESLTVTILP